MKQGSRSRSETENETAQNFDPGNTSDVMFGSSNKKEHVNTKKLLENTRKL